MRSRRVVTCGLAMAVCGGSVGAGGRAGAVTDRPPVDSCAEMAIDTDVDVGGFDSERYAWRDSRCELRSVALVDNDRPDPSGHFGGFARELTYRVGDDIRTCTGSFDGHPGFGEVVNHFAGSDSNSSNFAGTYRTLLAGPHHALHEYRWRYPIDGHDVTVIVQWFFATGRDHPIYAITFDLTGVADGSVVAASRAPYGDVQWDGGAGSPVSGVGWGDRYRFESLASPISLASGWTYETPNRVPYSMMWTEAPNAEMGLVQTETWEQHDAGGYWFYPAWGTRDDDGPMPEEWNWPYQLNQYELPFPGGDASKRLAWGMNFGAVGQSAYPVLGDDSTASGWPFQSYAVAIVLGTHSSAPVASQAEATEAMVDARITASVGRVLERGPGGVGRNDEVTRAVPGYDPRYAVWDVEAEANQLAVTITPSTTVRWPIFVVHDWTAPAPTEVLVDGIPVPVLATLDEADNTLWLTVATEIAAPSELYVR